MFDDLHEIAENSAYLKAVEEKDVSTEVLERLPRYEELGEWEERLREANKLTFEEIRHQPAGFYLFLSFLRADYASDKGYFVRDAERYQKMRFVSARRKVAGLIYERYVRPREDLGDDELELGSVFDHLSDGRKSGDSGSGGGSTGSGGAETAGGGGSLIDPKAAALRRRHSPFGLEGRRLSASAPRTPAGSTGDAAGAAGAADGTSPAHSKAELGAAGLAQRGGTAAGRRASSAPSSVPSDTSHMSLPTMSVRCDGGTVTSMLSVGLSNPIGVFGAPVRRVQAAVQDGSCGPHLFDEVMAAVMSDLRHDAFPRFLKSPFYREYVRTTAAARRKVTLRDFQTFRVLGRGGFGSVHACRKADSGAMYAMKMINKRLVAKKRSLHHIMGEREVLKTVRGRHVTNLKYALQDKENLVLVMDLMLGGDLKFHLARAGRFPPGRARFYAAEVLLGLDSLHALGIVYRDLKLENVLLDERGHVRLSDLGLAVFARGGPGAATVTGYAGTPGYAAPEVVARRPYGTSADLFSYGVMLYRMISGAKPFREQKGETRDAAVARDDPPFAAGEWDPAAESLVRGLLCKDPARRLGCGPRGLDEVKEHEYFRDMDWGLLEAGYVEPPFVPNRYDVNAAPLRDIGDFDEDRLRGVELDDKFLQTAERFDYVSEEALQEELVEALEKCRSGRCDGAAGGGGKQAGDHACCRLM